MKLTSIIGLAAAMGLAAACAASAQDTGQPGPGAGRGGGRGAMRACHDDAARLCAGVEHGGGRMMQCMRDHHDQLSEGCKSALAAARDQRRDHPAQGQPASQDQTPH